MKISQANKSLDKVDNKKIYQNYLNKRRLHLNFHDISQFAMNMMEGIWIMDV